jgi:hypothetical protein
MAEVDAKQVNRSQGRIWQKRGRIMPRNSDREREESDGIEDEKQRLES